MPKTLLAMGAHFDDCVFGVPGLLLQAIAQGHRAVLLTLIGGDDPRLVQETTRICAEYGAELRYLDFRSQQFTVTPENTRRVAEVVAEVQPDLALLLWSHDHHHDHEVAAELCRIPLRQSHRLLAQPYPLPAACYAYDNGPGHTIGFVPDTYVDITEQWPAAQQWLSQIAAVGGKRPEPGQVAPVVDCKEVLARYRGYACGVRYAEALCSLVAAPRDILA